MNEQLPTPPHPSTQAPAKGLIAWFTRNSVAANLLMIFIIVGGILAAMTIRKQMFPLVESNWINITVPYPGAAPQEVEQGITIKIEQALDGLEGLKRVITYSNRGFFNSWLEVDSNYQPQELLDEIKLKIDAIASFPDGMERPIIKRNKPRQEVMYISLFGDLSLKQLKELGNQIHREIQDIPQVNISSIFDGLNYEIAVEVSPDKLREYQLSLTDIAMAIRNSSADFSAGQIRTQQGFISIRVENQAYQRQQFEQLPLINRTDGTQILLGDIATINDGFVEGLQYSKFNGKNAITLFIGASSDQSIGDVADAVNKYIKNKQHQLPQGVELTPWVDMTFYLDGRLNMMLSNMIYGGLLVFIILSLFLRIKLAFWVMMGLPVSFLGALFIMPMVDVTINLISLFAFILVLGVVVDDAIVVGESVSDEIEREGHSVENVIRGVKRVAIPATFGVLTTVAAFMPMVLSDGPGSEMSHSIGFVVILCLLFSLVESKLILPAHLAQMTYHQPSADNFLSRLLSRVRGHIDRKLNLFITNHYQPLLVKAIHYRYTVLMLFIGILLLGVGLFSGGLIRYIGMPQIPHDYPRINIEMKQATSEQATVDAIIAVEQMLKRVDQQIAAQYGAGVISETNSDLSSRLKGKVMVKLTDPQLRQLDTFEIAQRWREAMPTIAGLKSLSISDRLFGNGRDDGDISFRLTGNDEQQLNAAVMALKQKLASFKGVSDINDSQQSATKEVQFTLKPLAASLGLTLRDVASQVNFSFYGIEAQRILRDGEEIKVMLRYPKGQRSAIADIEQSLILTPTGHNVLLSEVAELSLTTGVNRIRRENGKRTVNVWAAIDSSQTQSFKVVEQINESFIPLLLKRYPGVTSALTGKIQHEKEAASQQLTNALLSLLVIFALLAIPLRSYSQPLIIMSVIPFGVIGAMLGHLLLGFDLSTMSIFGIIAASGVVINDSLIMVDFVNGARASGMALKTAVIKAGGRRFRAITLTSLTTFVGLMPIIFETSMQAKVVIPMAISLAFGVAFATVITLLLIPCLYVILEDIKALGASKQLAPTRN